MGDRIQSRRGSDEGGTSELGLSRRSVLGLFLAATGSGAAAGTSMDGVNVGQIVTTIEQSVVIGSKGLKVTDTAGNPIANANATVSDDRTEFRAGTEINQGDQYQLRVDLKNRADTAIWSRLKLSVPSAVAGVEITNNSSSSIRIQRLSMGEWQLRVPQAVDDGTIDFHITVAFADDVTPGFHTISAALGPESTDSDGSGVGSGGSSGDPKTYGGEGYGQGGYGH